MSLALKLLRLVGNRFFERSTSESRWANTVDPLFIVSVSGQVFRQNGGTVFASGTRRPRRLHCWLYVFVWSTTRRA